MTDPREPLDPDDDAIAPGAGLTSPGDIASAARSCSVILVVIAAVLLLLCVAFTISQLV